MKSLAADGDRPDHHLVLVDRHLEEVMPLDTASGEPPVVAVVQTSSPTSRYHVSNPAQALRDRVQMVVPVQNEVDPLALEDPV